MLPLLLADRTLEGKVSHLQGRPGPGIAAPAISVEAPHKQTRPRRRGAGTLFIGFLLGWRRQVSN
jgi:hypothetical protein